MGELIDLTTKTTRNGIDFIINREAWRPAYVFTTYVDWNKHNRQLYLYSCSFQSIGSPSNRILARVRHGTSRFWNILIKEGAGLVIYSPSASAPCDIFNFVMQDAYGQAGLQMYSAVDVTIDRVTIASAVRLIWTHLDSTFTLTNVYSRLHTDIFANTGVNPWTGNAYLIDFDVDSWVFNWGVVGATGEAYRQYTFNLTVTTSANIPIQNANVTLTYFGQGGGIHGTWLTDANGEIPSQTVTAGFYNQTGGNTIYSYNPYEIKITKDGYLTYQRNFTQLEQKSWNIALLITPPSGAYAGFPFWFFGLIVGVVVGSLAFAGILAKRH